MKHMTPLKFLKSFLMYYKDDLVSIVKQKYVNASGGFESGTFLLN